MEITALIIYVLTNQMRLLFYTDLRCGQEKFVSVPCHWHLSIWQQLHQIAEKFVEFVSGNTKYGIKNLRLELYLLLLQVQMLYS